MRASARERHAADFREERGSTAADENSPTEQISSRHCRGKRDSAASDEYKPAEQISG